MGHPGDDPIHCPIREITPPRNYPTQAKGGLEWGTRGVRITSVWTLGR
jgi:hypothetical protein